MFSSSISLSIVSSSDTCSVKKSYKAKRNTSYGISWVLFFLNVLYKKDITIGAERALNSLIPDSSFNICPSLIGDKTATINPL